MVRKVFEGLYAFIWQDNRQNNCNSYLIDDGKRILIDPGHSHLFSHVEQGLASLKIDTASIDLIIITHAHPDHMEAAQLFKKPCQLTMGSYRVPIHQGTGRGVLQGTGTGFLFSTRGAGSRKPPVRGHGYARPHTRVHLPLLAQAWGALHRGSHLRAGHRTDGSPRRQRQSA